MRDNIRLHEYLLDVAEGEKVLVKLTLDPSVTSGAYPSLEIRKSNEDRGANLLPMTLEGNSKKRSVTYTLDPVSDSKLKLLVSAKLYGVGIDVARSEANEDLLIRSVKRGSQADYVGIRPGDLLLSINKKSTKGLSVEEVINRIRGSEGSTLSFALKRKDVSLSVSIPSGNLDGIEIVKTVPDTDLLVSSVKKGSPSDLIGVKAGDILLSINKKETKGLSIEEVMNRLRGPEGSNVSFALRRKDASLSVLIPRNALEINELFEYRYTLSADSVTKRK
jgi:C-terminal processing protease CtpA/Prc